MIIDYSGKAQLWKSQGEKDDKAINSLLFPIIPFCTNGGLGNIVIGLSAGQFRMAKVESKKMEGVS